MEHARPARPQDRAAVTAAIAAAFAHDPAWTWLHGDDYERLAPRFAGVLFDLRVDSGQVWVTGDPSAAALWEPPGPVGHGEPAPAWAAYREFAGEEAWQRLTAYEDAVDAARPATPYWYLGVLATRPDAQGHGLATAVMTPILDRADAEGVDCCLETSTLSNKAFYARRGFSEATEVTIASGPPTWWLRRPPGLSRR